MFCFLPAEKAPGKIRGSAGARRVPALSRRDRCPRGGRESSGGGRRRGQRGLGAESSLDHGAQRFRGRGWHWGLSSSSSSLWQTQGMPSALPRKGLWVNLPPLPLLRALGARAPGIFPRAPEGDAAGAGWKRALSLCPCGMWDSPAPGNRRCRHGTALAGCLCLPLQHWSYF